MKRRPRSHEWSEATVGREIVRTVFKGAVLAVPRCNWTGYEADILLVTRDLRLIDVEVKISRADLRADINKDKWWQEGRPWSRRAPRDGSHRRWPPKVWKHYYALPESVWSPDLLQAVPEASGILLLAATGPARPGNVIVERMAKPNRDAEKLGAADAVDIARLAGLRMWDALDRLEASATSRSIP